VIGIFILGGISYAVTRNWSDTTIITIIFHTLRLVLFYSHERIWERVEWGRKRHPLASLPVKRALTEEDLDALKQVLAQRGLYGWQGESI